MQVGVGQVIGVESLEGFFARTPRFGLAYSGGCDSTYLLAAALEAECDVRPYLVRTAFQPPCEVQDAQRFAAEHNIGLTIIDADVLAQRDICANPPDRCYACKRFIFSTILERMSQDGYRVLADGTNVSDNPERRPGFRALAELGVVSPLRRAGMEKDAVRAASREIGLFTADKPSFSCLAVHVPEGAPITGEALAKAVVSPEVAARMVARNAAIGAALGEECNPAFRREYAAAGGETDREGAR